MTCGSGLSAYAGHAQTTVHLSSTLHPLRRPPPHTTTTFESPGTTCNPESGSTTTVALNDNIEILTVESQDMAEACPSTCQMAETTTEEMEVGNLGGPSKERTEDLGRCVAPPQSSLRPLIQVVSTGIP